MWSTRANMRRPSLVSALLVGTCGAIRARGGRHPQRGDARAAVDDRHALHEAVNVVALEDLVLQELVGEGVEQVAMAADQRVRRAVGRVGQLLLLLVADAPRQVGD